MTTQIGVTTEDVRRLLSDRRIFPDLPGDLADDTALALDSMGLVWFLHQLWTQFGIKVDPADEELAEFDSVAGIVTYVNRTAQRQLGGMGG
ncbi:MAG: acyl carrier protein [Kutzneria sp.]|nr:acyl carrier protein [Kutzneria sp.]MBV9847073.1 acyl carrier protein [Kutzneria sp.]